MCLCYLLISAVILLKVQGSKTYGWGGYYWLYWAGQIAFLILARRQFLIKAQLDRIEALLEEQKEEDP